MKPEKGKWYWVFRFSVSTSAEKEKCVAVMADAGIFRDPHFGDFHVIPEVQILSEADAPEKWTLWHRFKTLFQ